MKQPAEFLLLPGQAAVSRPDPPPQPRPAGPHASPAPHAPPLSPPSQPPLLLLTDQLWSPVSGPQRPFSHYSASGHTPTAYWLKGSQSRPLTTFSLRRLAEMPTLPPGWNQPGCGKNSSPAPSLGTPPRPDTVVSCGCSAAGGLQPSTRLVLALIGRLYPLALHWPKEWLALAARRDWPR